MTQRSGRNRLDRAFYKADRTKMWEDQNKRCHYCKKELKLNEVTFDHIVPFSKVRAHKIENCVVSCAECDVAKDTKSYEEFTKSKEMNWAEEFLHYKLTLLDEKIKRVEYARDSDKKGSFNKWKTYWNKRNRWEIKDRPTVTLGCLE